MRGQGRIFQRTYRDQHTGEVKRAATFTLEYYVDGKMRREATGTTNATEALRQLKSRQGQIAQGRRVDPAGDRLTFDQLAAGLLDDYRAHGRRSLERVENAIGHLRSMLSGYRARTIDGTLVTKYIVDRQMARVANATINRELAALKRMYRLAQETLGGYCPTIRMLEEDNVRRGFFERSQFEALLTHLPDDLRPAISTAYITGWRIGSELFTRRRHHVDLGAGWLRLEPGETKNRKRRMFPLTPELHTVLERQLAVTRAFEQRTGCVVPWLFHREGRLIRSIRRAWVTACRKAGVPERIPHDFRRTAVRNLERAGVPRSTAMAMVGHQTEAICRRYAIVDETMLREGAEKLAVFQQGGRPAAVVIPLPMGSRIARQEQTNTASDTASGQ
jgi:integrase